MEVGFSTTIYLHLKATLFLWYNMSCNYIYGTFFEILFFFFVFVLIILKISYRTPK